MIAVTGATGKTGHNLVEELLKRGEKVRAIAHNPAHLKRFADKGVETFAGGADDADAMSKAFDGASAVYALIPAPPPQEVFRAYQNRVADTYSKAVERAGVKHVIALSSLGAQHTQGTGPVAGLHDLEQRLNQLSDANVLSLRPTFFMENSVFNIPMIKQMGINGGAVRGDLRFEMIATRDIGAYAAKRFTARDFSGKSFQELLGPRQITWNEVTAVLGKAIGNPDLKYVQFSYADTINGMAQMGVPRSIAEIYTELAKALNDGLIVPETPGDALRTPTTIEEFAQEFAAVYQNS